MDLECRRGLLHKMVPTGAKLADAVRTSNLTEGDSRKASLIVDSRHIDVELVIQPITMLVITLNCTAD